MLFLIGDKLLSLVPNKLDKNKEILALILYFNPLVLNKEYSNKLLFLSFRVFWKDIMVLFSHMVKLVQEKHILCKEVKLFKNIEV